MLAFIITWDQVQDRNSLSGFIRKVITFLKSSGRGLNLPEYLFFFTFWSPGSPSLLSEPMKTCFVGGSVTFTCQVSRAYPPAKILWLRNLTQPEVAIQPSDRYLITQDGQSSTLTIRNCSQALDEGYYVCRAENPVGVREVDIWLSVKGEWGGGDPERGRWSASEDQVPAWGQLGSSPYMGHCHKGEGVPACLWLDKVEKLLPNRKSVTLHRDLKKKITLGRLAGSIGRACNSGSQRHVSEPHTGCRDYWKIIK